MKILVNVARELLAEAHIWAACEGVRLSERADGSFDLEITRDLARAQKAVEDLRTSEVAVAAALRTKRQ